MSKLKDAQTKWNELIEQEDEQVKSQNSSPTDNRKHENIDYHDTDSESEETNSETHSNDETSNMLDEDDMDIQQSVEHYTEPDVPDTAVERDINFNNRHIDTDVNNRTRPNALRRKISRLTSEI